MLFHLTSSASIFFYISHNKWKIADVLMELAQVFGDNALLAVFHHLLLRKRKILTLLLHDNISESMALKIRHKYD